MNGNSITTFFQILAAMLLAVPSPSPHPEHTHVRICLHLHHLCPSRSIRQSQISSSVPTRRNGGGAKELAERQREGKKEMAVISFCIFLLLHVDFY